MHVVNANHADDRHPTDELRHEFVTKGVIRFTPELADEVDIQHFLELQKAIAELPRDPYATGGRHRAMAKGIFVYGEDRPHWIAERDHDGKPVATYVQDTTLNPEADGAIRVFEALPQKVQNNPLLLDLIRLDRALTFWPPEDATRHLLVHVHLISLRVETAGEVAEITPPHLHRDGEPFTFVHLLTRRNLAGGVNAIAPPSYAGRRPVEIPDQIISQFELTERLDSYGVVDQMVSHYVEGVRQRVPGETAERGVLLVDFTPLVPRLVP